MLSGLLDALIPRTCAGCGIETVTLCADCLRALDQEPLKTMPRYGTISAYGAGAYSGSLRRILVEYKEHDRRDLVDMLGLLLARALVAGLDDLPVSATPVVLVPVPARKAAQRRRGGNHVALLASAAVRRLRPIGLRIGVAEALEVRGRGDHVGMGAHSRRGHVVGTHRVRQRFAPYAEKWRRQARVVIVDDIVTTGATAAEAARALRQYRIEPVLVSSVGITGESPRTAI